MTMLGPYLPSLDEKLMWVYLHESVFYFVKESEGSKPDLWADKSRSSGLGFQFNIRVKLAVVSTDL